MPDLRMWRLLDHVRPNTGPPKSSRFVVSVITFAKIYRKAIDAKNRRLVNTFSLSSPGFFSGHAQPLKGYHRPSAESVGAAVDDNEV